MKVLVVEDDKKTAGFLRKGFLETGFEVEIAECGDRVIPLTQDREFDVIVLDVLIPPPDGWAVLESLRKSGNRTPVLFLTALDSVDHRVKGLELGADDYLVKPFAFSELLARIRTIVRRSNSDATVFRVADLELDFVLHRAVRDGRELSLSPKEFLLLGLFTRRAGETLSRELIGQQVWGMRSEADSNVVDVHVRRLRAKVDEPFPKNLIHTVRGAGYVLEDRN